MFDHLNNAINNTNKELQAIKSLLQKQNELLQQLINKD